MEQMQLDILSIQCNFWMSLDIWPCSYFAEDCRGKWEIKQGKNDLPKQDPQTEWEGIHENRWKDLKWNSEILHPRLQISSG